MAEETQMRYVGGPELPFTVVLNHVYRAGILQLAPGQSATGYGSRIATDYMIRIDNGKILRRVYAFCYSNSASHYVFIKGVKHWFKDHELQEAVDKAKEINK